MKNKYFKYNKDDILEILIEAIALKNGFKTFSAKANLIVDNEEFMFIGAIGELESEIIDNIDLEKLYLDIDYNGTHKKSKTLSNNKLADALSEAIKKADF